MGIFKDVFKFDKEQAKRDLFNCYLNSGMDRVEAYQMAYKVSYEEAIEAINRDNYEYLINAGISEEEATKMAFRDNMNVPNRKK